MSISPFSELLIGYGMPQTAEQLAAGIPGGLSADTTVLTTPYAGAAAWDAAQPFSVERTTARFLLPTPALAAAKQVQ